MANFSKTGYKSAIRKRAEASSKKVKQDRKRAEASSKKVKQDQQRVLPNFSGKPGNSYKPAHLHKVKGE